MEYLKFKQLVKGGEKDNVDFKIECNSFLSRTLGPKAELAKDICGMANNGNVASYIFIGVSDDGKSFKSVSNPKLTDDNLQRFCRGAIFPAPKVKLYRKQWAQASPAHAGKLFVIIQVGPHARQAFHLARDYIDYANKVCYRRNEVWIRRGRTSDLASPVEVAYLVRGLPPEGKSKPEGNVNYSRLPRDEQIEAMTRDLRKCVEEIGGWLSVEKIGSHSYANRVVVPLRNLKYVWRCVLLKECTNKLGIVESIYDSWECEHGCLFLVVGTVSKQAFREHTEVNFKEKWGWFSYDYCPYHAIFRILPQSMERPRMVILTLSNLKDTDALRSSFCSMLQFLSADRASYDRLCLARKRINAVLKRWLRKRERGDRLEEKDLRKTAQSILRLSAGKLL